MNCIGFNPFFVYLNKKTLTSNVSVNKFSNFITIIKIVIYISIIFSKLKIIIIKSINRFYGF